MVKNLSANAEEESLIPGWKRSSEEANGNTFQYSSLGNPVDRRTWWSQEFMESKKTWTRLSNKNKNKQLNVIRDMVEFRPTKFIYLSFVF